MKTRFLPILLALPMFAPCAFGGEIVDLAKAAPADAIVRVSNVRGEVAIVGWDKNEVTISGELDDLAEELVFEVDGRRVTIEVKMPNRDVNWGDGSDLRIYVPLGSRLRFDGVSTDLDVENVKGGSQLRTVSGDVDVDDMAEQLSINTVSGDIEIDGSTGRTQASSISGEIEMDVSARDVSADSVSGDITLVLATFDQLTSRTVSGEADVQGELLADGRIQISSVSGDVELRLVKPVNAELDIESGMSGDIENDLTNDEPAKKFPGGRELRITSGDGSGSISISTVSADIRLR